ncbi:MAG TPA: hypothetical protein VH479_01670 [Acidimicrobiales bacterium]|jgi:hypothetical protein
MTPPYRFGKGTIVEALEETLRDTTSFNTLYTDLTNALTQLSAGTEPAFVSKFKQSLTAEDLEHLQEDVFGEDAVDSEAIDDGQERRRVYYEGLKRAMDLARELGSDQQPAEIEIFWGCGQRTNECWISWGKTAGTVITLSVLSNVPATPDPRAPRGVVPGFPVVKPEDTELRIVRPGPAHGIEVVESLSDKDNGLVGPKPT